MRSFLLIIVFVFYGNYISSAQENQQLLFKVIDAETQQPVPYTTIQFANKRNGVIANLNGDFRIPIRYKKQKEILIISCIGYSTKRVALQSLSDKSYYKIYLNPKVEQLNEVVINSKDKMKLSARQIVINAIANIQLNYPIEPFSYIGYYRDYQIVDEKYINLNEGIAQAYDQGFLSNKMSDTLNKTALYSYKLNTEFTQDSLLSNAIYNDAKQITDGRMGSSIGNELTLLNIHNPIRNYNTSSFSFVYILERDFLKNHKFFSKGVVYLDNEELYKIKFIANKDITGEAYKAEGFIFISKDDFSIHKFDYKLFSDNPRKLVFTVDTEYKRQENDRMYLNYITFNNNFFISHDNALTVKATGYNIESKSFFITFNRVLNRTSIENKNNIKLYFKNKKLAIHSILLFSQKTIEVKLKNVALDFLSEQNLDEEGLFSVKIRNFKDARGFTMEKSKIEGYQFRELFIQRVFLNKTYDSNLIYIDKWKSLKDAIINDINTEDYWLNSPLKTNEN